MAATTKAGLQARPGKLQDCRDREKAKRAALQVKLAEALEQQEATSEILRVIRSSPTALQPTFQTILASATRLCKAHLGLIYRYDGDAFTAVAFQDANREFVEFLSKGPIRPGPKTALARLAVERQPVHFSDITVEDAYHERDPLRVAQVELGGARTLLAVPMFKEGELLGAIVIYRPQVRPFTQKQIDLVSTFADQAAIAIENSRLFNETRESLERQMATSEVLKIISRSLTDVQPVFEAIARNALTLCGSSFANVYRYDGKLMHYAASHQVTSEQLELVKRGYPAPPDRGRVAGRAILSKSVVCIEDALADPDYDRDIAVGARWRRMFAAPMLREGEPLGAIAVGWTEPGPVSATQQELLKTFADQAVIAIENVRLFNETQEALERQTATAEILKVISSSPADVQPVFDTVMRNAVVLCKSLFGTVFRYDGEMLHYAASHNLTPQALLEMRSRFPMRPNAASPAGRAILTKAVVHIGDAFADSDYVRIGAEAGGWREVLAVPMLREGEPIGVIDVFWAEQGMMAPAHEDLLKSFADQAVIAIENVRLFNETKEALERQTATAEILNVISSSPTDVQPVFDAIVRSAMGLVGGYSAVLTRVVDDTLQLAALTTTSESGDTALRSWFPMSIARGRGLFGRMIRSKAPICCSDTETDPDADSSGLRELARARGFRAVASVPLICEAEVIGTISVTRRDPGPFSVHQLALLNTFASQAVIAIENVRLFNETKEALERQTATAEILKVISSSPTDVQPVFDAIAEYGVRLCNGGLSFVLRFDGELVTLAAHHNVSQQEWETLQRLWPMRPHTESIIGRAVLERRVVHVPDYQVEFPTYAALLPTMRSVVAVPMLRVGIPIGVLTVFRREIAPFTRHQIDLLQTFADQAVIAIENVRLFNETKEALERQTATAEILKVISSSPTDVQPVFDAIAESAMRLMHAFSVQVCTFDGEQMHLGAARGALPGSLQYVRQRYPSPPDPAWISGRCVIQGKAMNIADCLEDADPAQREFARHRGYRAALAAPMLRDARPVGAIVVTRASAGSFAQAELHVLRSFADQAVIAIENVRLFKELEARTEALGNSVRQLTALGEVGQAISSTLDLETVLRTIVSRARQLSGLDGGAIYEYDERAEEFHLRAAENFDDVIVAAMRTTPIRKGQGAVGGTAVTGEPTQIQDTHDDRHQSRLRELLVRAGYRAMLAVPLLREDQIVGALLVSRKTPGSFSPEIVGLLKTFASQSALAIQNARLFREIAEKSRQLEEASRHKSRFLASMSHELRTPLNAILGFNEMILGEIYGAVPHDMQEPLNDIQTSGKHLLRLINNVLDLAKIEAGRMELALADYSVQDTVESVRSTLRPLAAEKGLEFLASVPNEIPLAHGDSGRITQCLMNLAGNSLKFTKAGKVEISVEHDDERLTFRVSDTGMGIAQEKIGSLFTEFKQTDATIASEYGGSGLGLSITRKFIEMHGGRIWVESELGKGSSFIFQIPLRAGEGKAA